MLEFLEFGIYVLLIIFVKFLEDNYVDIYLILKENN